MVHNVQTNTAVDVRREPASSHVSCMKQSKSIVAWEPVTVIDSIDCQPNADLGRCNNSAGGLITATCTVKVEQL